MRDRQKVRASVHPLKSRSTRSLRACNSETAAEPRKRGDLFSVCFEHTTIGFSVTDLEGRLVEANPAYCKITGYTESELHSPFDIDTLTHPADLPEILEKIRSLESGEIPAFTIEQRYIRKDGSIAWVRNNVSLIRDEYERPKHLVRFTEDITAHKTTEATLREVQACNEASKRAEQAVRESEERYRELFENSKDAIYVHDMSGRYTSVNRAAEKLSGYNRDELIGRHFSCLLTQEYARHVREQLCKKLEDADETTYEVELITKRGRRVPVEISSRLIVENGLPVGVQGCVRDISERQRAQEASRTYSRRLIDAQEAERRRISLELHDQVGQILTAVKMNLHALKKTCDSREVLTSIEENLKAIDEAVDEVRDLSVDLRPLLLDDFGLVVALRWYLDRQAKNGGIAVEFASLSLTEDDRFSPALETACFRIVQEAVTNVIRHAHASHVSVRLERTGSELMLVVTDDGVGFDVKAMRSGATGATTLGLRGMEERAQAAGGTVAMDSAPALGTQICASFSLTAEERHKQTKLPIDWVVFER